MSHIRRVLSSRWLRVVFVATALALAVVAVSASWEDVRAALTTLDLLPLVAAVLLSPVYLCTTMLLWRALLRDLGSRLSGRDSFVVFFVSQLGKYLPGSVWNVVAAAELGADRDVPRRRSLTAMAVTVLLSLVSGLALGIVGALLAPSEVQDRSGVALWLLPLLVVLALPAVINRMAALALRLLRRPPLDHPLTSRGAVAALSWAVVGWLLAGAHVWLLGVAAGMEVSFATYLVCVGGYALAWTLGFLFIPVPAGVGIREAVLVAVLTNVLDRGGILVLVLLSRVVLTVADVALAAVAALMSRKARPEMPGTGAGGAVET